MTRPRDGWDDDERRALKGLEQEFEALRARHRDDPPFELLRAADADALPEPLQAATAEHLEGSAWSRALVAGADADATLDADGQRRLLARIQRSSRATPAASWWRPRLWMPALAAAAVLVVMVGVLRRAAPERPFNPLPAPPTNSQVTAAPAPAFTLPLDKPEVKLTPAALVLRSEGRDGKFVDDIAPALDAYRAGDYPQAERRFSALEARYPNAVEVLFYRAVSQLFLNDPPAATRSLQAARRLDNDAFAAEIGWYLAVAYERAGDTARARAELDSLCRSASPYALRACDAAATITRK